MSSTNITTAIAATAATEAAATTIENGNDDDDAHQNKAANKLKALHETISLKGHHPVCSPISVKSEHSANSTDENNGMSCVYNSESPTGKTILITNYSHNGNTANCSLNINNANNKQKSSITIYTHKPVSESTNSLPTSSINILINNHYDNAVDNNGVSKPTTKTTDMRCSGSSKLRSPSQVVEPMPSIKIEKIENENLIKAFCGVGDVECGSQQTDLMKEPLSDGGKKFCVNDDVLIKRQDGRFYLGTIIEIDTDLFLVKFDDNTEQWSKMDELTKLDLLNENTKPMCVACKDTASDPNAIVHTCIECHRSYHEKCTEATVDRNALNWCCQKCSTEKCTNGISQGDVQSKGAPEKSSMPISVSGKVCHNDNKLPYNLSSLTWDTHHRKNIEQIYCYCGKNGIWFEQMLQCARCLQWFHGKCVKCLSYPLYFGDRFYLFACANCNHGVEFLRRLEMSIEDVVHLLLFNLTFHFKKSLGDFKKRRYYSLKHVICPYAKDNWHAIQLPHKLKTMNLNDIKDEISKALRAHPDRFKAGGETKNKVSNWSLKSQSPPKAPNIALPSGPLLTEKYINDLFCEQARIYYLQHNLYNSSEQAFSDAKIKDLMCGKNYALSIDNANNEPTSSDDTDSGENVFTSASDEDILADLIVKEQHRNHASTSSVGNNKSLTTNDASTPSGSSFDAAKPMQRCENSASTDPIPKVRKRGRPRLNRNQNEKPIDTTPTFDFNYSSDDTSSRGTLDSIIPPPKNFSGINNPFLIDSNSVSSGNSSISAKSGAINCGNANENSMVTAHAKTHIQLVRTVKRRLSAKDIIVGPNMEVKRRKVKKRLDNVEVINTSTLENLPQSATYLPIRSDSKRISIAALRSSLKGTSNALAKPKSTTRNRSDPKYLQNLASASAETTAVAHNDSALTTIAASNGETLLSYISSSPIKDAIRQESMADLQTSLNIYFGGVTNRIENGENFVIKGRRISMDGRLQYLIEWEGVS